jgi:hypothetical protein
VDPDEAEEVVRGAAFVVDEDGTAFVIHCRELTMREKGLHRSKGR